MEALSSSKDEGLAGGPVEPPPRALCIDLPTQAAGQACARGCERPQPGFGAVLYSAFP